MRGTRDAPHLGMPNRNGRATPNDDDRYGRSDRQILGPYDPDEGGFRSREDSLSPGDVPFGFQSRHPSFPGRFEDHPRSVDERFAGRGGSAYWQPAERQRTYDSNEGSARRRHMVGNYGRGSDSYPTQGGSMLDPNQGVGQQGHFGGSPGGYGHVGSYGAEGGAMNHGTQGWQGNQSWESHQGGAPRLPGQPGTGGQRGKGPKNFQRSDERIREAVSEALEIDDDLDATEVEVLVKGAEVTLSGSVDDRRAKRLAEDITAAVSGVKDVHNQLKLSSGMGS